MNRYKFIVMILGSMTQLNKIAEVTIIVLNWNGWKDTIECLESLYQIEYPNFNVIIIDNDSKDNSIDKIKNYCEGKYKIKSDFFKYNSDNKPIEIFEYTEEELKNLKNIPKDFFNLNSNEKITIIKNSKNYGFAEGNNIGIKFVLNSLYSNYILLLNNDTVVDKDFLEEMITILEENPKIGVAGPKIYYYDYDGKKDITNFEGGKINFFKGEASHISHDKTKKIPQRVDYVEGSCFLIKKDVIESVGLLDPEYFLYWEEADWCVRIKKNGYKLIYVPQAKIWHKVETSISKTNLYYMTRNRFLFIKKNFNKVQTLSSLLYFFLFKFWFRLFTIFLYYKKPKMIIYFTKGIKDGLKFIL